MNMAHAIGLGGSATSPLALHQQSNMNNAPSMNSYGANGGGDGIGMGVSATTPDGNAPNNNVPPEVDVTSVIQEKPGMYAYPYRVQPGEILNFIVVKIGWKAMNVLTINSVVN